tara:strand:- start:14 stop:202 length:189 start_codon:yes stop_codon:yes gene_type:complete
MSNTHANCVNCSRPYSLSGTPVYCPENETVHLEDMTTQEKETSSQLIDWNTCFEVDNIRVAQ